MNSSVIAATNNNSIIFSCDFGCMLLSVFCTKGFLINNLRVQHQEFKWYTYAARIISMRQDYNEHGTSNINAEDIIFCSFSNYQQRLNSSNHQINEMEYSCSPSDRSNTNYVLAMDGVSSEDVKQVPSFLYLYQFIIPFLCLRKSGVMSTHLPLFSLDLSHKKCGMIIFCLKLTLIVGRVLVFNNPTLWTKQTDQIKHNFYSILL